MFWGIVLKPNKKYTQVVKKSFHLSQASLDLTNCENHAIQVYVSTTDVKILIATLSKAHSHVMLDLVFSEKESISFHTQGGSSSVHLSGYFLDDEENFGDLEGLDEEVDSEEEAPELVNALNAKAVSEHANDEEDTSDSEDDTFEAGDDEEAGSEEDDDEQDSDDSEESSSSEVQEPKAKQIKLEKPKQNGIQNGQKPAKQEKKQQQQQQPQAAKPERTLSGNVKVVDVEVGKGDEAKSGKKVQVYYEGRLKTGKVFDTCKQGNGYKFKLGQGEVIKGWDIGVVGMKVGGKRRIVCPPHMAYGAKGSLPVIPPNSTLVFDVELKKVI